MRRIGFSIAEVLVVIAIVMVLLSLLKPVVTQARVAAGKTVCQSHLKQQFVALSIYRDACEGTDAPAHSTEMGLPPFFAPNYLRPVIGASGASAAELTCRSPRGYPLGTTMPSYAVLWPDVTSNTGHTVPNILMEQQEWIDFVTRLQSGTVLIIDPNHQSYWPATQYSNQFALGVTLSGNLVKRVKRGTCLLRSWWEDNP